MKRTSIGCRGSPSTCHFHPNFSACVAVPKLFLPPVTFNTQRRPPLAPLPVVRVRVLPPSPSPLLSLPPPARSRCTLEAGPTDWPIPSVSFLRPLLCYSSLLFTPLPLHTAQHTARHSAERRGSSSFAEHGSALLSHTLCPCSPPCSISPFPLLLLIVLRPRASSPSHSLSSHPPSCKHRTPLAAKHFALSSLLLSQRRVVSLTISRYKISPILLFPTNT